MEAGVTGGGLLQLEEDWNGLWQGAKGFRELMGRNV